GSTETLAGLTNNNGAPLPNLTFGVLVRGKFLLITSRRNRFRFFLANLRPFLSPCELTPRTAIIAHREGEPAWRQRRYNSVRTTGNTTPTPMYFLRTKFSVSTTYTGNKRRTVEQDSEKIVKSRSRTLAQSQG